MSEDKTRVVVRMPALGDGVFEGVVRFLKPPGAQVQRDEPVAEVETDKVSIELVAPESGTIESLPVADLCTCCAPAAYVRPDRRRRSPRPRSSPRSRCAGTPPTCVPGPEASGSRSRPRPR